VNRKVLTECRLDYQVSLASKQTWFCSGLIWCCRSTTPGETKLLASEIYELLQASSSGESEPAEEPVGSRRKAQFFLGSSNKRAKTVILHIDGLDDSVSPNRSSFFNSGSSSVSELRGYK